MGHLEDVAPEIFNGQILCLIAFDFGDIAQEAPFPVHGGFDPEVFAFQTLLRTVWIGNLPERADQIDDIGVLLDFRQIDEGLDCFPLPEVVSPQVPVDQMVFLKPVGEEPLRGGRCFRIAPSRQVFGGLPAVAG